MTPQVTPTILFSTGNIIAAGRTSLEKSNEELINSLRQNFKNAAGTFQLSNNSNGKPIEEQVEKSHIPQWLGQGNNTIYVPGPVESQGLNEERDEYDITVKLFFLPSIPTAERNSHTRQALEHILHELHVANIDLLIASFPDVSFDADDDSYKEEPTSDEVADWVQTYSALEEARLEGKVNKIGLAEFGVVRLEKLLPHTKIKPSVDQINVRDCCVVPKPLIIFAREQKIELLTHNDCTDILPASALSDLVHENDAFRGLRHIKPLWVAKYTAVIQDRGVVENKGYFAMASVGSIAG